MVLAGEFVLDGMIKELFLVLARPQGGQGGLFFNIDVLLELRSWRRYVETFAKIMKYSIYSTGQGRGKFFNIEC
jgi:hypothetical protein